MIARKSPLPILGVGAALALHGCALKTAYDAPRVAMGSSWRNSTPAIPSTQPADTWWRNFDDLQLDTLVARTLARNNDRAAAVIALRRAQLQAGLVVINPTVTGGASYDYTTPLNGAYPATRTAGVTGSVSYEVDLFGALNATRDVARWEARATQQDLEAATLTLIGTTVKLYYQIGFLNSQVTTAQQSLDYARRTLELVKTRRRAGAVSALEVAEAERTVSSQQANLRDFIEQRVEARNALDLLLNGQTEKPEDELQQLPENPRLPVDPGLPVDLLGRRPDLKAAEMRVREQLANVDQTRLSFYPVLSLTGTLHSAGSNVNPQLSQLFSNPVGTLAANLSLPFLQVNQVRLAVASSRLLYEQDVIHFRQTLYKAVSDVENALAARASLADRAELLQTSLNSARTVERMNEVRYKQGAAALQLWLDAQDARRQAEVALAQVQRDRIYNQVTLYEALGGDARSERR